MNRNAYFILIIIVLFTSCSNREKYSSEMILIKNLYQFPLPCIPIQVDTLSEIKQIGEYLDSICLSTPYRQNIYIGLVYNLQDSTFVPSTDSINNITIPCGLGNPSDHWFSNEHALFISFPSCDSLLIKSRENTLVHRIPLASLEDFFAGYLRELAPDGCSFCMNDVLISMDISKNPSKSSFVKTYSTLFWTFHSEMLTRISSNPRININELVKESEADPDIIYKTLNGRIHIFLMRDSTGYGFLNPILTPQKLWN
jgi:hypothetical protein